MKTIYWLASYPKSGNTWARLFLANYRGETSRGIGINQLGGQSAASLELFETFTGLDATDLTPAEIEHYRPRVYAAVSARQTAPIFMKVHDACTCNAAGEGLFPAEATAGVIYLVRNPLDVAVSLAHATGSSMADAAVRLCDEAAVVSRASDHPAYQLPQKLLSWSGHARSWLDQACLAVHLMRYEDLLAHPAETFGEMLQFAGLPGEPSRLQWAQDATRFERLQAQEAMEGFVERQLTASGPFFRRGQAGGWRTELNAALAQRLIDSQGDMMRRLGYLTEAGEPVY